MPSWKNLFGVPATPQKSGRDAQSQSPRLSDREIDNRLAKATRDRHMNEVRSLLAEGANPNALCRYSSISGAMPIVFYSLDIYLSTEEKEKQIIEILQVLVHAGADINARSPHSGDDNTFLMTAAMLRYPRTVEWLIDNGASVDIPNNKGQTPFQYIHSKNEWDYREILGLLARSSRDGRLWLKSEQGIIWMTIMRNKDPLSPRYLPKM